VVTMSPEAHKASYRELRQARRWAGLAERVQAGTAPAGYMTMFKAGVMRKAGRFDEALAIAGPLADADEARACAIGLVLRRLGRPEESEQAFARAIELSPRNESPFLENGDTWFDLGRWDKALLWYEGALKIDADQPWAKASARFCRWKLDAGQDQFEAFIALCKEGNGRAREIWYANFDALPEPHDATANVWRQAKVELEQVDAASVPASDFPFTLTLSALEAPSNLLAIALDCRAHGRNLVPAVTVEAVPQPDPRQPVVPVDHLLWRCDTGPRPTLGRGVAADRCPGIAELFDAPQ
jgi:tetratricopeptide (TPR) repeat protein